MAELVEPFAGRSAARKQLRSYGTQLRRTVKRSERRGATARRKATTEARPNGEREARTSRKVVEEPHFACTRARRSGHRTVRCASLSVTCR